MNMLTHALDKTPQARCVINMGFKEKILNRLLRKRFVGFQQTEKNPDKFFSNMGKSDKMMFAFVGFFGVILPESDITVSDKVSGL